MNERINTQAASAQELMLLDIEQNFQPTTPKTEKIVVPALAEEKYDYTELHLRSKLQFQHDLIAQKSGCAYWSKGLYGGVKNQSTGAGKFESSASLINEAEQFKNLETIEIELASLTASNQLRRIIQSHVNNRKGRVSSEPKKEPYKVEPRSSKGGTANSQLLRHNGAWQQEHQEVRRGVGKVQVRRNRRRR